MKHESDVWLAKNGVGRGKTGAPAIRLGWGTRNRRNLEVSWLPATSRGMGNLATPEEKRGSEFPEGIIAAPTNYAPAGDTQRGVEATPGGAGTV